MPLDDAPSGGLFDSLRRICDTGLAHLQRRVELLSVEFQEEKLRQLDLVMRVGAAIALGLLTLMAASALIVVAFWRQSPVLVLALLTLLYGGATALTVASIRRRQRLQPPPFAATLDQFRKDRECFGKKS